MAKPNYLDPLDEAMAKRALQQPLTPQEVRLLAHNARAVSRLRPLFAEMLEEWRILIKLTRAMAAILNSKTGQAYLGQSAAAEAEHLYA